MKWGPHTIISGFVTRAAFSYPFSLAHHSAHLNRSECGSQQNQDQSSKLLIRVNDNTDGPILMPLLMALGPLLLKIRDNIGSIRCLIRTLNLPIIKGYNMYRFLYQVQSSMIQLFVVFVTINLFVGVHAFIRRYIYNMFMVHATNKMKY